MSFASKLVTFGAAGAGGAGGWYLYFMNGNNDSAFTDVVQTSNGYLIAGGNRDSGGSVLLCRIDTDGSCDIQKTLTGGAQEPRKEGGCGLSINSNNLISVAYRSKPNGGYGTLINCAATVVNESLVLQTSNNYSFMRAGRAVSSDTQFNNALITNNNYLFYWGTITDGFTDRFEGNYHLYTGTNQSNNARIYQSYPTAMMSFARISNTNTVFSLPEIGQQRTQICAIDQTYSVPTTNGNNNPWKRSVNFGTNKEVLVRAMCDDGGSNVYGVASYMSIEGGYLNTSEDIGFFKINSSGTFQYCKKWTLNSAGAGIVMTGCAADSSGNLYGVGLLKMGYNAGNKDIVVFKWNTSGGLDWARKFSPKTNFNRNDVNNGNVRVGICVDSTNEKIYIASAWHMTTGTEQKDRSVLLQYPSDGSFIGDAGDVDITEFGGYNNIENGLCGTSSTEGKTYAESAFTVGTNQYTNTKTQVLNNY